MIKFRRGDRFVNILDENGLAPDRNSVFERLLLMLKAHDIQRTS